jgi:PIN domain nuclease of toxin-antitoxin system
MMKKIFLEIQEMRKALLDTHIFFWIMEEYEDINSETIEKLKNYDQIYIAAISIWELALLENKSRIFFSVPLSEWIKKSLKTTGIKIVEFSNDIMISSVGLGDNIHKDPADRMIIATAKSIGATLFTRDKNIIDFMHEKFLHVIKA